ncbi:MAG: M3 family metallopeptidase [Gemmatimonadales bacterium]|nr:M3 family metallopeptidase [Gemmatimonadales bacterium]
MMIAAFAGLLGGCSASAPENPFFTEWETPFGVPPFDLIQVDHFEPATLKGIETQRAEINTIADSPETPTFENTIETMDRSGTLLAQVRNVFGALNGALTNEELQGIAKRTAPLLSKHRDETLLNEKLFARVNAVHEQRENLGLDAEQMRLLTETHKRFVRGGANLDPSRKEQLKALNEELALLSVQFGENVLKETNQFELVIEEETDLAGLPSGVIAGAAEDAAARGHEGKWVFTLNKPSLIPFITYSERRELREKLFKGYIDRGDNGNELDNKEALTRMATIRLERARLLGYDSHAHFILADNMALEPQNVYELLGEIWKPALERAKEEAAEFQAMIDAENPGDKGFKLEAWDWWYYAEKVKKARFDLDEEMTRPYFEVNAVREGMFDVAEKLWGLKFIERPDIPVYHEDVKAFEVTEADGTHVAVLMVDYFPRPSKRGGAWMSSFRKEYKIGGDRIAPVVFNVGNFSKPTADKPALLSLDEVSTMFHEFGHGLHGMLSQCTYRSLSGTSVARDFVELPSQIMENWAVEPEVLAMYAKHYETGEPIPAELVTKIQNAQHFNQGFATTEYLAACFLDMDWHTLTDTENVRSNSFEKQSMERIGLIKEIESRYRSPYFRHIFAGGYSAGYYAYVWAEVLDADAFQAFKETGDLFDKKTALSFRTNILERGGAAEPMELYKEFRGKEPGIDALLARKGLK